MRLVDKRIKLNRYSLNILLNYEHQYIYIRQMKSKNCLMYDIYVYAEMFVLLF